VLISHRCPMALLDPFGDTCYDPDGKDTGASSASEGVPDGSNNFWIDPLTGQCTAGTPDTPPPGPAPAPNPSMDCSPGTPCWIMVTSGQHGAGGNSFLGWDSTAWATFFKTALNPLPAFKNGSCFRQFLSEAFDLCPSRLQPSPDVCFSSCSAASASVRVVSNLGPGQGQGFGIAGSRRRFPQ
jgi:hypothetical protein